MTTEQVEEPCEDCGGRYINNKHMCFGGNPMTADPYAVPCPECSAVFTCEFFMQNHQMSHWPQPHAFIDLFWSRQNEVGSGQ